MSRALEESALLIVVLLFLFLWNLRSTIVVLLSIPISILIAFIMMDRQGLSANLQSLGGLAIGIGMMVDGSIVMVENIVRHLAEEHPPPGERLSTVMRAAREVGRPVFFAVLIIIVVFLPLFTLQGVEGKLFSPMAFTISFAMLGSLLIALFLVPALAFWVLRGRISERESFLVRAVKRFYEPVVRRAVAHPGWVVAGAVVLLGGALALVPQLGTEFVPQLEEGTLLMRVTMNPSISLDEAIQIGTRLETMIVKHAEVAYAISSIGRAELGGDPEGVSNNEIMIGLKSGAIHLRKELAQVLDEEIGKVPGILLNFSQPIATRVDELLSGVKAEVAIKLFGDDLDVLARKGAEIESLVRGLPGASDVQLEQVGGETQLVVKADRDAVARRGLNVADCMDLVSTAVGGEAVGQVLDGDRRNDIYMRLDAAHRRNVEQIESLLLKTPSGARVPLAQVASVEPEEGPPAVNREHARRRVVVQCNVRGRDLGGFVEEGRNLLERKVAPSLPPGYSIQWGGQFENQQRAQRTLSIVVPLAILLIFVLLVMSFGNARSAALILLNVPFSLIGGVIGLFASGQYLSVPSSIGFIAVFGVAVLNGVVLVAYIRQLRSEGLPVGEAAVKGALLRIRPVLMTALVAILGLVPLVLSRGVGSEVQRPLATVVIGGIVTSTLLTLIVLPAIFRWFAGQPAEVEL
ncbi:MAG: CusA/CzcA family heavy metal efflux RND transporter [Planctomycetota bacterium]